MSLIGYARISTAKGAQVLDRQLDALQAVGCEHVFEDRASGAKADRLGLAGCLDHLRRGDVLVVLDLDRLGRLAAEIVGLIDELSERGIAFKALNSPMDTTTPAGRAFLQIQAAFAEMERNVIRQRVREGLAAARARGRKGGRPRVMTIEKLRCPALDGRPQALHPVDLPGARRPAFVHPLPLPPCRRRAEDPKSGAAGGGDGDRERPQVGQGTGLTLAYT